LSLVIERNLSKYPKLFTNRGFTSVPEAFLK